jgi:tRNA(Ile)-lysidine synthase
MSPDLRAQFARFAHHKQLVKPGDRVLVAVSGGIDSMVLLHLFKSCAPTLGVNVQAAHFNHAMRAASAADAEWLGGVCEAWQIPLIVKRSTQALYGEAAARTARYAFLQKTMRAAHANRIATAHHADDQIETVLFRLLRGTGLRGLAGIPVRRGAIIRPLLRFRKLELLAYAQQHDIAFREDETNTRDVYARNRIRRALIPAMQSVHPAAPEALLTLSRYAARTERAWRSILASIEKEILLGGTSDSIQLARGKLLEYDAEIRARLLRSGLRRLGVVPGYSATRALLRFIAEGTSGSGYDVAGGIRVERAYDAIRIARIQTATSNQNVVIDDCGDGSGKARIGGQEWCVRWTTSPTTDGGEHFDCRTLKFPVIVRAWLAGDRMRMSYGTKKLKKLFAERRVPFNERAALPVVVDAENDVLWVPGIARSSAAEPADETPALTITVSHAEIS